MSSYRFFELDNQYKIIKKSFENRLQTLLTHKLFINGPEVQELEKKLEEYAETRFALTTNSGTSSLILSLMALGVKKGDEIITSSLSFGATAFSIILTGATPVFVDIEEDTGLIDVSKIKKAITKKTKGILPVSIYGQPYDKESLQKIAEDHNLFVLEDACQSFGSLYKKKPSYSYPLLSTVSFFPAKPLGAYGNAGCILTNDHALAKKIKKMRNHGQSERFFHEEIGFNALMNTFQAITLLSKLEFFEDELKMRRKKANYYDKCFFDMPHVKPLKIKKDRTSVRSYYILKSKKREIILEKFQKEGKPLTIHYPVPFFDQPAIKAHCKVSGDMKITKTFSSEIFSLPLHAYLEDNEQKEIIDRMKSIICSF